MQSELHRSGWQINPDWGKIVLPLYTAVLLDLVESLFPLFFLQLSKCQSPTAVLLMNSIT